MKKLSETHKEPRPVRIMQFGQGNFLRGFVDYMVDISNERGTLDSSIAVIKPRKGGNLDQFKEQNHLYTVILRGMESGQRIVRKRLIKSLDSVISPYDDYQKYMALAKSEDLRFVVSNTTEAGIVFSKDDSFENTPPESFPAKITQFLYHRYQAFGGAMDRGLIFLPTELIDQNGDSLRRCVLQYIDLWNLDESFKTWVEGANIFCNTLVDRIVSGYPKEDETPLWEDLGYRDELMVTGELYGFWAIGSHRIEEVQDEWTVSSPIELVFAKDIDAYKQRKVRILNGAHTSLILAAYLCGYDKVDQCLADKLLAGFMDNTLKKEIIPQINLDKKNLYDFADSVSERFKNPYLGHKLLDISLNSTSKWRARVLPSFLDYIESEKTLPRYLTFSLAAYIAFYRGLEKTEKGYVNDRNGQSYFVRDDPAVLDFYAELKGADAKEITKAVLGNRTFWGQDLTEIDGLEERVSAYLVDVERGGMKTALTSLMEDS